MCNYRDHSREEGLSVNIYSELKREGENNEIDHSNRVEKENKA